MKVELRSVLRRPGQGRWRGEGGGKGERERGGEKSGEERSIFVSFFISRLSLSHSRHTHTHAHTHTHTHRHNPIRVLKARSASVRVPPPLKRRTSLAVKRGSAFVLSFSLSLSLFSVSTTRCRAAAAALSSAGGPYSDGDRAVAARQPHPQTHALHGRPSSLLVNWRSSLYVASAYGPASKLLCTGLPAGRASLVFQTAPKEAEVREACSALRTESQ